MKGLPLDQLHCRAELLVHLGLGAAALTAVILAVGTMLNFSPNVDAIATRLTVPPAGPDLHYFVGDRRSPTNLVIHRSTAGVPAAAAPTNAQPTATRPSPHRTAG